MLKIDYKPCSKHSDCFARENGRCKILVDTNFGLRDCPFYKAKKKDKQRMNRKLGRKK